MSIVRFPGVFGFDPVYDGLLDEARPIVDRIKPILAGQPPELVGVILADLLAIWLASHVAPKSAELTQSFRAELLATHCAAVRQLTDINAMFLGTG